MDRRPISSSKQERRAHSRMRNPAGYCVRVYPPGISCENATLPDATREAASASATKTDCELVAQTSSSCGALRDVPGNTRPSRRCCQGINDRVTCPRATRGGRSCAKGGRTSPLLVPSASTRTRSCGLVPPNDRRRDEPYDKPARVSWRALSGPRKERDVRVRWAMAADVVAPTYGVRGRQAAVKLLPWREVGPGIVAKWREAVGEATERPSPKAECMRRMWELDAGMGGSSGLGTLESGCERGKETDVMTIAGGSPEDAY